MRAPLVPRADEALPGRTGEGRRAHPAQLCGAKPVVQHVGQAAGLAAGHAVGHAVGLSTVGSEGHRSAEVQEAGRSVYGAVDVH